MAIVVKLMEARGWLPVNALASVGGRIGLNESSIVAIVGFALLAFSLYYYARKPLESKAAEKR